MDDSAWRFQVSQQLNEWEKVRITLNTLVKVQWFTLALAVIPFEPNIYACQILKSSFMYLKTLTSVLVVSKYYEK